MKAFHLIIKGRVQGVFYRQSARVQAGRLGITGWVRNNADGSVEAIAAGPDEQLGQFVAWCRKGPAAAYVTDIIIEPSAETSFRDFTILRS